MTTRVSKIFLVFLLLFTVSSNSLLRAWDFNPDRDISGFSIDKNRRIVSFNMIVYHEIDGGNDDNLVYTDVLLNGVTYLKIACKEYSAGSAVYNAADDYFSMYAQDEDTWGAQYLKTDNVSARLVSTGDYGRIEFEFEIAEEDLYANEYTLSFGTLKFEDDGDDYSKSSYTKGTIDGWPAPSISNVNASDDMCDKVDITWESSNGYSSDMFYRIKKGSTTIKTEQGANTSFTYFLGETETSAATYTVTIGYGKDLKQSASGSNTGGPPTTGYSNPSSFTASNHTCNEIVLQWTPGGSSSNVEKYVITSDGMENITCSADARKYTIRSAIGMEDYRFTIRAENECGFRSSGVTATSSHLTLSPPSGFRKTSSSYSDNISLAWNKPSNVESYLLRRTSKSGSVDFEIGNPNTTSYTDDAINGCEEYTYHLFAVNGCTKAAGLSGVEASNTVSAYIEPNLSSYLQSFDASKAYYPDKVLLEWEVANDNISLVDEFVIMRREAGQGEFSTIATVIAQSSYEDFSATGGVLYEYKIHGKLDCEGVGYSNYRIATGFRKPYGIVSGIVNYENGVNVKGVEVMAEKSAASLGTSLDFEGIASVLVSNDEKLNPTEYIAVEAWIRPENVLVNAAIIDKESVAYGYKLSQEGNNVVFGLRVNGSWKTVRAENVLVANEYIHVAGVKDSLGMKIYVNGEIPFTSSYMLASEDTSYLSDAGVDQEIVNLLGSLVGVGYDDFSGFQEQLIQKLDTGQAQRLIPLLIPIIKNDELIPGTYLNITGSIQQSSTALNIGANFNGQIDEIRIWNTARNEERVYYDYKRVLGNEEEGLMAYWRCDENFGTYIYDAAKSNGEFHKNDGSFTGNVNWSSTIPSKYQLGWMGKTDKTGAYLIPYVPYTGSGENFTLTPRFEQHQFNPNTKTVFIGEGSAIINGQDFTDISSFKVTGKVSYENTSCGVEGVIIGIDGEPVIRNGQPVYTDQDGRFEISVPVGNHYVSVQKNGHEFRSAKFPPGPETATYDFQEAINGINFIDNTTVRIVGRVVGGTIEGDKKPGLGLSVNNIGQAEFIFESATGFGCSTYGITTDSLTGEFSVDLPPMVYLIKNFDVSKNPAVSDYFSEFPQADFSLVNPVTEVSHTFSGTVQAKFIIDPGNQRVTVEVEGLSENEIIEDIELLNDNSIARFYYNGRAYQYPLDMSLPRTVVFEQIEGHNTTVSNSYNYRYDLIYRTVPQIRVTAADGESPFRGERSVQYEDPLSKTLKEFNVEQNPFNYPVFMQGEDYSLKIFAEEVYFNQDVCEGLNGCPEAVEDRVAVNDGEIHIQNQLAINVSPPAVTLKNGEASYAFKGGEPNTLKDHNFPWRDYSSVLNITVNIDDVGYEWMPVESKDELNFVYEPESLHPDDKYFRGYVLGANPIEGSDFITNGPQVVDMILRDPPGNGSYAYLEKGSSFSFEQSLSSSSNLSESMSTSIQLGVEFESGIGYILETESDNTLDFGFSATQSWSSSNTLSTTYSTSETWQTSELPAMPGAPNDLFFGSSKNFFVSLADNLTLLPDTFANRLGIPTAGKQANGFKIALNKSMMAAPEGESTHFIYTADHIENALIPNLISLRNNLFKNDIAYTSKLPRSHELFGSNNDDPRWKEQATTEDWVNTDKTKDYDGPSYRYIPQDSVEVQGKKVPSGEDKVRDYNQQIRLWEEALERNEMEKYHATLVNNISFDAGPRFEKSVTTEVTQSHTTSFETNFAVDAALNFGLAVGGIGFFNSIGMSFDYTSGKTSTKTQTDENTFGYVLFDEDEGDYYSVDVMDPGTGTGPVFITKGGRSMCPHEEAVQMKYYVPSRHEITTETIDTLRMLNADADFLTLLSWGERTASYEFSDIKNVFPFTDDTKDLIPDEAKIELKQFKDRLFRNKLDLAVAIENLINAKLDLTSAANAGVFEDLADNLEGLGDVDFNELNGQLESDDSNSFKSVYLFTESQRTEFLKEWSRYRAYIYDMTGSPLNGESTLGSSTLRREVPKISITPDLRENVPDDNKAYFTLQLGNASYSNEPMWYETRILQESNPDGAIVAMDGGNVTRGHLIGAGEQINKTISVAMGKPDVYEYNDIQIVIYSVCERQLSGLVTSAMAAEAIDTATFSVHFVPSCTDIDISRPKDDFIINTENEHLVDGVKETKVPILMSGYDLNNTVFEKLNFQFKSAANPDWIKTEDFYVNSSGDNYEEIPGDYTAVEWDLSGYPDGEYNLRAKTYCGTTPDGTEIFDLSEVWSGVVDRKPPLVFGTPQPADGILSPDDDIIIEFNEKIFGDKLNYFDNFDIRGILNGTDLQHDVSVAFDNNTNDFVRIPYGINLVGKSFTIEFWMRSQRSFTRECIFSQNTDPDNAIQIMLTEDGELEFQVGDQYYREDRISTSGIINQWHHWTFVYDDVRNEAIVMMDGVPLGSGTLQPSYTGYGDVYLGKSLVNDGYPFQGNIHELRIWERPRTASAVTANMLITLSGKETGLIGYWPLNDADGEIAAEKVHRRNATVSAPWDIRPKGYAATFESSMQGHMDMRFSDIAFGEEEDFSIEFWFKSDEGSNICFVSNGYGDENDLVLYYYSIYDLALTANVLPLEDNVESLLSPIVNTIYTDEQEFLQAIGNLMGSAKAEKYSEQLIRFGKHMPTYWSINTDASGNIQVNNNGKRIKTEGENYFDNQWHHLALVVQRVGNTRLYIDGELKVSEPSTEWNGFGAARLFVGARGLFNQNIPGYEFDQFFDGSMDELRIWNTAVKQSQIERNRTMRLDGDELGLLSYFPFESYEEVMGIPIIDGYVLDMLVHDSIRTVYSNIGVYTQNTDVPNVRMKRPSSKVDFSFVAQEDRVAFVLNEPNAKIENCILDITTKNVEDMHGNKMSSPVTWSAYIDRNQVKWGDQQFDLEKEIYAPLSFTTTIKNFSGQQQFFALEGLPGWATAEPREGTLEPLSEQTVTITISEGVNVGTFSKDISLKTDFGFDEKLQLNLRVYQPLPGDWAVTPEEYEFSMNIIGYVSINDVISADPYDKVAAFVDGECRGIANLKYVEDYDMYQVYLDVYSNRAYGEYFELHIWDAGSGREFRGVLAEGLEPAPEIYHRHYEFIDNNIYGSPGDPLALVARELTIQKLPLSPGWNWKSFNLHMDKSKTLNQLLEGYDFRKNDMIKGLSRYSEYMDVWIGSLNFLDPEDMYMFKVDQGDTLKVSGVPVDPNTTPIPVLRGWNWIGYTPAVNIGINDALGLFDPHPGDLIKSQYAFAMYDPFMGWVGTLEYLRPGFGYKYRYTNEQAPPQGEELYFPRTGSGLKSGGIDDENDLVPGIEHYADYPSNMSLIARIEGLENQEEGDRLIVYAGGEQRGRVHPLQFGEDTYYCFLTVYGNFERDELSFVYQTKDGRSWPVIEKLEYVSDSIAGNMENPVVLTVAESALHQRYTGEIPGCKIYPNPFSEELILSFGDDFPGDAEIAILDAAGKELKIIKHEKETPDREKRINTSALIEGIYLIKIKTDDTFYYKTITKIE